MKVVVWQGDLSEDYLRWVCQIGADGVDLATTEELPGVKERGYPDLDKLLELARRIRRWGLGIYRFSLPTPRRHMLGQPGGEEELDGLCKTIEHLGEAEIPIARPQFLLESLPPFTTHESVFRGGYTMRGFSLALREKQLAEKPQSPPWTPDEFLTRCKQVYERILPVAEETGVKLALHPSDPPLPGAPFDSLGWHHILDAFPSPNNGLLYCVGTRHEAGGSSLVLDEINKYGRMGKIFHVHFRNVRGSLASAGGFEEVLLNDGDMNMFRVLLALDQVGYDGGLNPDHMPRLTGDTPDAKMALAYSVGYIKALLAALEALP
ncbi:MAG: mannonate dehydratase [Candidatus Bathyarchaeia archaeon]